MFVYKRGNYKIRLTKAFDLLLNLDGRKERVQFDKVRTMNLWERNAWTNFIIFFLDNSPNI